MTDRATIRKELLDEIIGGYDQLSELLKTGGMAPFTGHVYDPKESERELKLIEQLKQSLVEMREKEANENEEGETK